MKNYNHYCASENCGQNCGYSRNSFPVSLDYTPMRNQIGDYSNQENIYTTI